jgi:hypothetical protein
MSKGNVDGRPVPSINTSYVTKPPFKSQWPARGTRFDASGIHHPVHQVDFNMQEIDEHRIYLRGQRYFSMLLITNMVLEPLIAIDQWHDIRGVEIPCVAAAGSTNGL